MPLDLPEPAVLSAALQPALALPLVQDQRAHLDRLLADYGRAHAQNEAALVVALVGATGAGKSTLLNALAGAVVAPEGVDRPTSREAVVYAPEDADLSALGQPGGRRLRVERYRLQPGALWAGQVFVDTPDLNSVEESHREVARGVLDEADVALVVLHRSSVAEAAQADFLSEFARRRRLVLVVNFADELGTAAREALRSQARSLLGAQWEVPPDALPAFVISARDAQHNVDATGDLARLLSFLRGLAASVEARSVRRSNAAAALESVRRSLLPALDAAESTQRDVASALERGMENASSLLAADLTLRLQATEGHLRDVARSQVAGRGWGPLSLALRLSASGSGGVAAGTLLLRQSVPVGLAVAGASAALERISRHARARAAEATVLEPADADDGSLAQAARAALTEGRATARRAGFPPEELGIRSVEELSAGLAQARLEAWRWTQGNALAEAVGRWWRWARVLIFPILNLALSALFVDVAYRVARAYYDGQYLDPRYYLNAFALAAVWGVVGTGLVSLTLRGAVRRARMAGLRRFEEGLRQLSDEQLALLRDAGAPWAGARRAAMTAVSSVSSLPRP